MKKLLILPLLFAISMLFVSCEDTATDPIVTVVKGSVYVQSTPVGAQIWVNNTNTGKRINYWRIGGYMGGVVIGNNYNGAV